MKSRPIATPMVLSLGSITILVAVGIFWSSPRTPIAPPATDNRRAHEWLAPRRVIRVSVVYDADFDRDREGKAEELIEQAFGIVNIEWQRDRGEWFEIADMQLRSSGPELDASHVLGSFLLSTASEPSTIRVRIVGRQLEVYSDGRTAMPVGGLAFRGSDVVLVRAPPTCPWSCSRITSFTRSVISGRHTTSHSPAGKRPTATKAAIHSTWTQGMPRSSTAPADRRRGALRTSHRRSSAADLQRRDA